MVQALQERIIEHLKSADYHRPSRGRLAKEMNLASEETYHMLSCALREPSPRGRVVIGDRGAVVLPSQRTQPGRVHRHVPAQSSRVWLCRADRSSAHEDLTFPRARTTAASHGRYRARQKSPAAASATGGNLYGSNTEIVERKNKRFAGTLAKIAESGSYSRMGTRLLSDRDAGRRLAHIKVGTKVVVEITTYPDSPGEWPQESSRNSRQAVRRTSICAPVIVQFNLPDDFLDGRRARQAGRFVCMLRRTRTRRLDMSAKSSAPSIRTMRRTTTTRSACGRSRALLLELGRTHRRCVVFRAGRCSADVEAKARATALISRLCDPDAA